MTALPSTSFVGAVLLAANFSMAYAAWETDFTDAKCGHTAFTFLDLSRAKGLDTMKHFGPSTVGFDTIINSRGEIPDNFLRKCGLPDALVTYLPSLIGSMEAIQFYSCFVSHSSNDKEFARRLQSRLRDEGLRVWFDEEDMKAGRELHPQIDEAIRCHDKLLLVLSAASIGSTWVRTEIRRARLAEKAEGRRKLFPIRLVDYEAIASWHLPDSSGEDLAEVVRQFFIPDFSNWKDHDAFEASCTKLLRDLKAEA